QRYLAKLSYRLACAGPFAFWVMATMYPPTNARALPPLWIQALWWTLCLCAPCGAVLGAVALFLFRKPSLGYRRLHANYAAPGLGVGLAASVALLLGTPLLTDIRRTNHSGGGTCLSNIKQLDLGVLMYTQDYDDRYPLPKTWNDEIYPYVKNKVVFQCPSEEEEEKLPTYAMNGSLKGKVSAAVDKQAQTVMLFDSIPGKNLAGGKALFPNPLRHNGGAYNTIGFADGHAKMFPVQGFSDLIWTPQPPAKPEVSPPKQGESPSR
ncbi:MAG: hypothetical protein JWN14_4844, partial [Chthonomonadales bacterium]|nr:hypothetical protein [Chthonomonadales bacterium]